MAIDKNTAAIVAAQLTRAWAIKTGPLSEDDRLAQPAEARVLGAYLKFRDAVTEAPIGKMTKVALGGV